MSVVVPENIDNFPETISSPIMGDRFEYPATILQALTDLATRTRWLFGNQTGDYGASGEDSYNINDAPAREPVLTLPPSARIGQFNPITVVASQLFEHIKSLRNRFTDTSTDNVDYVNETDVGAFLNADIPVIKSSKSPVLNAAFTGLLSKISQLVTNDSGFFDRIDALETLTAALNAAVGGLPTKIWGTESSPVYLSVPLIPIYEQAGPDYATVSVHYPTTTDPVGVLFQPHKTLDGVYYLTQNSITAAFNSCVIPCPYLMPGSKIKSVGFYFKGDAGHAAVPSDPPALGLRRQTYDSATIVANFQDTSPNVATYESAHGVNSPELNEIVDTNSQYYFEFKGEGGIAARQFLKLYRIYMTIAPK